MQANYLAYGFVAFQKFHKLHGVEFCVIIFIENKEKILENLSVCLSFHIHSKIDCFNP